jgi:hypothetical protein
MRDWLREPLVHFVLLGALLLAVVELLAPRQPGGLDDRVIKVSEDDLQRIVQAWTEQRGAPPTPEIVEALIRDDVREEVLAREAVALGLDRGDPIIRRRLAQKMDFLAADVAALHEPGEAELRDWYAANAGRFAEAPRISFRHLYWSGDRGAAARDAAAEALVRVSAAATADPGADPFMFRDAYVERTPEQVGREFGAAFAEAISALPPGAWSGPIASGYGWHLVHIDALVSGRLPAFEEVAPDVRAAWLQDRQQALSAAAFETMLGRYRVTMPELPAGLVR